MKTIFRIPPVFLLLAISLSSHSASVIDNAKITQIGLDKNQPNVLFIRSDVAPDNQSGRIACHNNPGWNYVLKLETPYDDKMFSMLLAANTSKQKVRLRGSGQCDVFGSIETLHVLYTY